MTNRADKVWQVLVKEEFSKLLVLLPIGAVLYGASWGIDRFPSWTLVALIAAIVMIGMIVDVVRKRQTNRNH